MPRPRPDPGLIHDREGPKERPMPAELTMPQLSETMSEGTVVKWQKK